MQGYVEKVHVTDNQQVKAGDLLVTLEVADYATRVSEAAAALQQSVAAQAQARAGVAAQDIEAAERETDAHRIADIHERLMSIMDDITIRIEPTVVVIEEVETDNWGIGGETVTVRRRREEKPPPPDAEAKE